MPTGRIFILIAICFLLPTVLLQAAEISGSVWDYYAVLPIGGAEVSCYDYYDVDTTMYSALTDPNGNFSVTLPPGTYYVAANTHETEGRFVSQYYGGYYNYYYSIPVSVTDAEPAADIVFYLYNGFKVSGTIEDADGNQVEASIYAYAFDHTTGYSFSYMLGMQSYDGSFSMHLPQGVYTLFAYSDDYAVPADLTPILVDDDTAGLVIRFPRYATISGTVLQSDMTPMQSVRVDALDWENGYSYGYDYTDDYGFYRIEGAIADRSYRILSRPGFNPEFIYWDKPGTFYPNQTTPASAAEVYLPGSGLSNIDIVVPDATGLISGRVTDLYGTPISGAFVYDFYIPDPLNPYVAIGQSGAYTDDDGIYTMYGIGPGRSGVVATATDYVPQIWDGHNMTTLLDDADAITIIAGAAVTDINFQLTPIANLGAAPTATAISPHLLCRGQTYTITITGSGFNSGTDLDLVDMYPIFMDGAFPSLQTFTVTGSNTIQAVIAVPAGTATGPYYIAITNPDSQYIMTGFTVIDVPAAVHVSLLAGPEYFTPDCTWSLGWNLHNLTTQTVPVDVYMGLALPSGEVVFYDGVNFYLDEVVVMYENIPLPSGTFLPQTFLLEVPLGGASLPAGEYLWVAAFTRAGTMEIIDFSVKSMWPM
ncbi:carboxypeptidase regulatory-like domain-containing protein [bacterium]|nr:carboxypeptidase regulatory-like domain-containing protein [candidate division CSSED10-310 bacterium]